MDDSTRETQPQPLVFNLGGADRIPPGQGLAYMVCGHEVAVFRQRNDRLFATENRCPHRQGPLAEGVVGGGKVICPLHAHKFDLCSGAGSEAHECIRTFPVRVENGEILLALDPAFFSAASLARSQSSSKSNLVTG